MRTSPTLPVATTLAPQPSVAPVAPSVLSAVASSGTQPVRTFEDTSAQLTQPVDATLLVAQAQPIEEKPLTLADNVADLAVYRAEKGESTNSNGSVSKTIILEKDGKSIQVDAAILACAHFVSVTLNEAGVNVSGDHQNYDNLIDELLSKGAKRQTNVKNVANIKPGNVILVEPPNGGVGHMGIAADLSGGIAKPADGKFDFVVANTGLKKNASGSYGAGKTDYWTRESLQNRMDDGYKVTVISIPDSMGRANWQGTARVPSEQNPEALQKMKSTYDIAVEMME